MKQLQDILQIVEPVQVMGDTTVQVLHVTADSRTVTQGTLFVACRGTLVDGHQYISAAIQAGAVAIIAEQLPDDATDTCTWIIVQDSAEALGKVSSCFYDFPSQKLRLVGITGTNGKTTTATLCYRLFRQLGYATGLISTIENIINDQVIPATHTTPDPVQLNKLLAQMVEHGCEYVFMEVSSHAIHQKRIAGLHFTGAVFTNITHDHLDYHKTFDQYIAAKKAFFDQVTESAFALVNVDDKRGMVMLQNCAAKKYTYSVKTEANFTCRIVSNEMTGLQLKLDGAELHTRLIGEFNAWNLLAVYAIAILLGMKKSETLEAISLLSHVNGRFEMLYAPDRNITAVVDYAHTPDAVEKVLETLKSMMKKGAAIVTVIGCGGDRDKAKRPIMAKCAAQWSSKVVLTSDNPRSEDPLDIIREMEAGLSPDMKRKVLSITDRREAIRTAIMLAAEGDVVLVVGKGHETYQEIKGVKYPFDDKAIIAETFQNLNN
jgi:UDP-N-acetylmuramoyl-L-alanyl-D-glutamate--2,6-diaminopimelate ligase